MTNEQITSIILAVLGTNGVLTALIVGIFELIKKRMDKKSGIQKEIAEMKSELAEMRSKEKRNETDAVRLQMLVMMADYPEDTSEILKIAERYFKELKGNWYLTSIFNKWLVKNDIAKPEWFKNND